MKIKGIILVLCGLFLASCTNQMNIKKYKEEIEDEINFQIAVARAISDNFLYDFEDIDNIFELSDYSDLVNEQYLDAIDEVVDIIDDRYEIYDGNGKYITNCDLLRNFIDHEGSYDNFAAHRRDLTDLHYTIAQDILDNYSTSAPLISAYEEVNSEKTRKIYTTKELTTNIVFVIELEDTGESIEYFVTPDESTLMSFFEQ